MDTVGQIDYSPPRRKLFSPSNKGPRMDTSIFDAIAGSGWPLISPPAPPISLENPSTFELALIGIATVAAYWAIRRLLSIGRQPLATSADDAEGLTVQARREAA
jgi:hypothetical protein